MLWKCSQSGRTCSTETVLLQSIRCASMSRCVLLRFSVSKYQNTHASSKLLLLSKSAQVTFVYRQLLDFWAFFCSPDVRQTVVSWHGYKCAHAVVKGCWAFAEPWAHLCRLLFCCSHKWMSCCLILSVHQCVAVCTSAHSCAQYRYSSLILHSCVTHINTLSNTHHCFRLVSTSCKTHSVRHTLKHAQCFSSVCLCIHADCFTTWVVWHRM